MVGDDCDTPHYELPSAQYAMARIVRDTLKDAWDSRMFLQLRVFAIFRVDSEPVTAWLSLAYCVWKSVYCGVREMCIFVRVTVHVCGASVSVLKGTG